MADNDGLKIRSRALSCEGSVGHKRAIKYTAKGLEEHQSRQINARRTKLSQITSKTNKLKGLMQLNENPDIVDEHLMECSKLIKDFLLINEDVLMLLSDEEKDADQTVWFKPKLDQMNKFMCEVERWLTAARQQSQEDVGPEDSASMAGSSVHNRSGVSRSAASRRSSRSSRVSSTSSVRQKAEHAGLLARAASLKQKQVLDMEECKLKAKENNWRSKQP